MTFNSLVQFLSSKNWTDYFSVISRTVNFGLYIYGKNGELFYAEGNPFCNLLESGRSDSLRCPDSCRGMMIESSQSNEPVIFKCRAGIMNFSFSIEWSGEKGYIGGRGGFASYEDLLEFLKITKASDLPIPVVRPLSFTDEEHTAAVAQYVYLTVNRLLLSFDEKYRLEEKFFRVMSLFDSGTFKALSRNPELMYRYILDTIEFVFGNTPASFMVFDGGSMMYKSLTLALFYRLKIFIQHWIWVFIKVMQFRMIQVIQVVKIQILMMCEVTVLFLLAV